MNCILLIYADTAEGPEEMAPLMEQHERLEGDLRQAGGTGAAAGSGAPFPDQG